MAMGAAAPCLVLPRTSSMGSTQPAQLQATGSAAALLHHRLAQRVRALVIPATVPVNRQVSRIQVALVAQVRGRAFTTEHQSRPCPSRPAVQEDTKPARRSGSVVHAPRTDLLPSELGPRATVTRMVVAILLLQACCSLLFDIKVRIGHPRTF